MRRTAGISLWKFLDCMYERVPAAVWQKAPVRVNALCFSGAVISAAEEEAAVSCRFSYIRFFQNASGTAAAQIRILYHGMSSSAGGWHCICFQVSAGVQSLRSAAGQEHIDRNRYGIFCRRFGVMAFAFERREERLSMTAGNRRAYKKVKQRLRKMHRSFEIGTAERRQQSDRIRIF